MIDFRQDLVTASYDAYSGVAVANATTEIDFKIDCDRQVFSGAGIICDSKIGDYISFHVVDKDNVLGYGAGVILSTFAKKIYVTGKDSTEPGYASDLPRGVYVRLCYTNTDSVDKTVYINVFLHTRK